MIGRRSKRLEGQRFDRLTVLRQVSRQGPPSDRAAYWECRCDCGRAVVVRGTDLRRGITRSCGCLSREINERRITRHSHTRHRWASRTYSCWHAMINRCRNPSHERWKDYGGRGIWVCRSWQNDFRNFLADMGEKPKGMTIDRINNYDGYYPENCRWATPSEQQRNRRHG